MNRWPSAPEMLLEPVSGLFVESPTIFAAEGGNDDGSC